MGERIDFSTYPEHAAAEREMDVISAIAFGQASEYVPEAELMGRAPIGEEFVHPDSDKIREDRLAELDELDLLSAVAFERWAQMRPWRAADVIPGKPSRTKKSNPDRTDTSHGSPVHQNA